MSVLDDSGRLFGRINVVDAIVVLLVVLAAVAAGVVLLDPLADETSDEGDSATRYATVHLGEQAPSTASQITAGDVATGSEAGDAREEITITDTYVGPGSGGNASVVVRVRIDGTAVDADDGTGSTFEYADEEVRRGSDVAIETSDYDVRGEMLTVDQSGDSLRTGTQSVLVRTSVAPAVTGAIEGGDRYRIGNRTVATIDDAVVASESTGTNRSALLGLSLETIRHSGNTYFGARQLLVDRTVEINTGQYTVSGPVTQWGNGTNPLESTTRTVVVKAADVPPEIADGIETDMAERRRGTTIATVESVRTEPATVVLTSDDGNIYEREHPRNLDVYLTVELLVRSTDEGLEFRLEPLREGSAVRLDFRTVVVNGTVIDVGA